MMPTRIFSCLLSFCLLVFHGELLVSPSLLFILLVSINNDSNRNNVLFVYLGMDITENLITHWESESDRENVDEIVNIAKVGGSYTPFQMQSNWTCH